MDIQLKKGIVEVCVLTCLKEEASYGYKIISDLSNIITISESTLYPILKRLEAGGFLTTYSKDFNGRLRKYYKITSKGLEKILEFLEDWKELKAVHDFITKESRYNEKERIFD